ncbi:uncharacterized protein LOC121049232 [Rosa chinensis]|uniref:uncharacterized protein LOC121049232 n=1 Tax=Rosa chinensis TaxID=74649 RepID=UPI001AD90B3F|nr:uncharacterized protein LOC121049232 [Rosa chinensis]
MQDLNKKKERQNVEFMELFKKVNINIPLLDAIKQVPSYAKYLKELCTNKRRFRDDENVFLRKEASSVIQQMLPPKLGDPGCFTVPCTIGLRNFDKALLDLGASINLMPYEVYKTLALEDIKPGKIRLQMADQSVVYPRGVVEDDLVKIDEILVPADFVVLDMEPLSTDSDELPIILGRSFMATAGTKIDVQKGILTMTVFDTTIGFRIFDVMKSSVYHKDCFRVETMNIIVLLRSLA